MTFVRTALLMLWMAIGLAASPAHADDDLLPVDEALALTVTAADRDLIRVEWTIAEGYYLYRHRIGIEPAGDGLTLGEPRIPPGTRYHDEFFGDVETYRDRLDIAVPMQVAGDAGTVGLRIAYQGCADLGICYPPQTRTVEVRLPADAAPSGGLSALQQRLTSPGRIGTLVPGATSAAAPLPEEQAFGFEAIADGGDRILMRLTPAPGYYIYRDHSQVRVDGDGGIVAGTPQWPSARPHHDEYFGEVAVYFEQIDVPLPLRRMHGDPAELTLSLTFQGCQDEGICYPPMTRSVAIALPAGAPTAEPGSAEPGSGPLSPVQTDNAEDASGESDPDPGSAIPASDNAARSQPPALPRIGLPLALLLGVLGGLILNLMPCVLPVLSLKVIGLARSGGSRAEARGHALWYSAGVLSAFALLGLLAIGLRSTGQALGWGFQLQQPWFVAALVYLMFAVGLSLSGVFTLTANRLGNAAQPLASRSGPLGDFFTGVLACVVASPCIAPFMGGALAFAFTASTWVALLVFLSLGLGLALPFLLIGFVPALASRLPKPGAWMETLKQVMAFPMYLAAVWLLWVLGRQRGADAMALVTVGLVLLALGAWWFERRRYREPALPRLLAVAVMLLALWPLVAVTRLQPELPASAVALDGAVPYSAERLQALRDEGRPVFVNMTADWCVTCKANERRVLSQPAFRDAMQAAGATYMVGDWTDVDPAIGAYLERYGAVGVPLYVFYPGNGAEGQRLPVLLGADTVTRAILQTAR